MCRTGVSAQWGFVKPYYEHAGITIFHGDCREILPALSAESIITDPVWPNPSNLLVGSLDPWKLWEEACGCISGFDRLVVQLGALSDPRFLQYVPRSLPFLRVCWLEYLPPSFRGKCVMASDVAYVFGEAPAVLPDGRVCIPGVCRANPSNSDFKRSNGANRSKKTYDARQRSLPHPAARRFHHVAWLVKWFAGESVIDPFGGSGTTALACKRLQIPCTLIEIEESYCELAANRLSQEIFPFPDPSGPETPVQDENHETLSAEDAG